MTSERATRKITATATTTRKRFGSRYKAERRRQEGGGDDDDLEQLLNPPETELEPPDFSDERLKELADDLERMARGEGAGQVEPDKGEPSDPF